MLHIDTLKFEKTVIAKALSTTDCTVFIQNCRRELEQKCTTESQLEKAKSLSDEEVVFR